MTIEKRSFSKVAPVLTSLAIALVVVAMSAHPAMAAATGGGGANTAGAVDFTYANGAIDSIIKFATGPVAKIIAIMAIIAGAVAFASGREVSEGLKSLGVIAICIGLLIGAGSMFGAGAFGTSGSLI